MLINSIYVLWNKVSVPLPHYTCYDFDFLGSRDVIGHVTIGLAIGRFLAIKLLTVTIGLTVVLEPSN